MRIKLGNGLIALNLLSWAFILITIFLPSNILRIVIGIALLLFFPGYALMAALFTKKERVSGLERVAISFGLSIAVVPIIGLILNYTPWGIRLEPLLYSVASFIFVASIIAWLRRRRLTKQEQFYVEFYLRLPGWGQGAWDKMLGIMLVIAILVALGTLSYVVATPRERETFTEFYIVGQEGKAFNYPVELKVGEQGTIIVGIINHEGKEVSYRIDVSIGGNKSTQSRSVVLVEEQKWEGEISFISEVVGESQKIEFLLYKDAEDEKCLERVYLWLNVSEQDK